MTPTAAAMSPRSAATAPIARTLAAAALLAAALLAWPGLARACDPSAEPARLLAGGWDGGAFQDDIRRAYSVRLDFSDETRGASDYPELRCGGALVFERCENALYLFSETIEYGGGCIDGEWLFEFISDDEIRGLWRRRGRAPVIDMTLSRRPRP